MPETLYCRNCVFYVIEDRGEDGKDSFCSGPESHMFSHALSTLPPAPACSFYKARLEKRLENAKLLPVFPSSEPEGQPVP